MSPERLHLPEFASSLSQISFSLVAIDEAHCISLWGHDFRPAYLRIGQIRRRLRVPFLALTATATPTVREEIRQRLRLRDPVSVVGSFDRPNLMWRVMPASSPREKVNRIRTALGRRKGASIIYAATRKAVEGVTRALTSRGLPAMGYHAGLPASVRSRIQTCFLDDTSPVVVATNAFGMGIDRSDVRLVLHYQIPGSLEAYYQEAGRGGRDGEQASCIALFGTRDRFIHDRFIALSHPPRKVLEATFRGLQDHLNLGREVVVHAPDLGSLMPRKTTPQEAFSILDALGRCGTIRMEELPAPWVCDPSHAEVLSRPTGADRRYALTLISSSLNSDSLSKHRSAREAQLNAVLTYAETSSCRRNVLLEYFGEAGPATGCGRCDRCRTREWWGGREKSLSQWLPGLLGRGSRA